MSRAIFTSCKCFQNQIDQLTMELGTEKAATQKLESSKLVLERQNKELKAKLAELETAGRAKTKVSSPGHLNGLHTASCRNA